MLQLLASEYRMLAQDTLAIILLIAAFVWGGGPERAVAAGWFVIFKGSTFVRDLFWPGTPELVTVDIMLASADFVALIVFVMIALYANRNYPLWIAAMQVLAMSAHLARGLVESISPIGYVVMVVAPGWIQLFLIAIGIVRHARRKNKYGPYRDWRRVRPQSGLAYPADDTTVGPMIFKSSGSSWRDDLK